MAYKILDTCLACDSELFTPYGKLSINIGLKFEIVETWDGENFIWDYGIASDEYSSQCSYYSGYSEFIRPSSNVSEELPAFLFGPHIASNVQGHRIPLYTGKINAIGDYHSWDVQHEIKTKTSPAIKSVNGWVAKSVTGFDFGTLSNFPTPICEPVTEQNIRVARSGNVYREYDIGKQNNKQAIKMRWEKLCEADASVLCAYLVSSVRSIPVTVNFGIMKMSNAWEHDGSVGSVYLVRLNDPNVKIEYESGLWSVEIEVIRWQ